MEKPINIKPSITKINAYKLHWPGTSTGYQQQKTRNITEDHMHRTFCYKKCTGQDNQKIKEVKQCISAEEK